MKSIALICLAASTCTSLPPTSNHELQQIVEQRYRGDRTGVCIAAAVIDHEVHRTTVCANPAEHRLQGQVALEIGSVTKTMTAGLLASLVAEGKLRLDDPLAQHLPAGSRVPTFHGAPILLKHLVTHTSGLPSLPAGFAPTNPANPYADLTAAQLIAALGEVELSRAPGARWEYSNFAVMLLSYVVARTAGQDYEALARARLFGPLAMRHTYITVPPPGTVAAVGHLPDGQPTSAWDFPVDLAGVGGVRATLDDMVRYAQAQLGHGDPATVAFLAATHDAVPLGMPRPEGDPEMGMGWVRATMAGRTLLIHDGGTGGFSSLVVVDPEQDRAVVVLADTTQDNLGGVVELALHLMDPAQPLSGPRLLATPQEALVTALVGRYRIEDLEVELVRRGASLVGVLPEGTELELGFDSHGDFFPLTLDALLTPTRAPDGRQTFVWTQGGAPVLATRL